MWTADHFIRDLQQLLYGDLGPARTAARDIAGDLAILIEHRQWATSDCDQRIKEIAQLLLMLRDD
jgi:hypothetical protein